MATLIPMAGEGKRFSTEGFTTPKPLIPVDGHPMILQAMDRLPQETGDLIFVCRDFHVGMGVQEVVRAKYPHAQFVALKHLTQGQACTCLEAAHLLHAEDALMIGVCDAGIAWDDPLLQKAKQTYDMLVFTFRHDPRVLDNPNQYGWIRTAEDLATHASVKQAISASPLEDHAICGLFWFKKARFFLESTHRMLQMEDKVRGEFYLDSVVNHAIALGLRVAPFKVQRFYCWGTPKDLAAYQGTL